MRWVADANSKGAKVDTYSSRECVQVTLRSAHRSVVEELYVCVASEEYRGCVVTEFADLVLGNVALGEYSRLHESCDRTNVPI